MSFGASEILFSMENCYRTVQGIIPKGMLIKFNTMSNYQWEYKGAVIIYGWGGGPEKKGGGINLSATKFRGGKIKLKALQGGAKFQSKNN